MISLQMVIRYRRQDDFEQNYFKKIVLPLIVLPLLFTALRKDLKGFYG